MGTDDKSDECDLTDHTALQDFGNMETPSKSNNSIRLNILDNLSDRLGPQHSHVSTAWVNIQAIKEPLKAFQQWKMTDTANLGRLHSSTKATKGTCSKANLAANTDVPNSSHQADWKHQAMAYTKGDPESTQKRGC